MPPLIVYRIHSMWRSYLHSYSNCFCFYIPFQSLPGAILCIMWDNDKAFKAGYRSDWQAHRGPTMTLVKTATKWHKWLHRKDLYQRLNCIPSPKAMNSWRKPHIRFNPIMPHHPPLLVYCPFPQVTKGYNKEIGNEIEVLICVRRQCWR